MGTIIIIGIIIIGYAVFSYNKLQSYAQSVRKQASNVQVAISKKLSLINQLIDAVKNYQQGEQLVQLKVSQDNTAVAMMSAYQQSGSTLASIQGMMERFPNLKANEQYQRLMANIEQCENDIQQQRMNYNNCVELYNQKRLKIPTIFIARFMGFSEAPYLQFDLSGASDPNALKEFRTDDGERLTQLLSDAGSGLAKATKSIAGHASQAGKLIADKIKEQSTPKYFYMLPGSTPKGPVSLEEIRSMQQTNALPLETMINEPGSDEWKSLVSVLPAQSIPTDAGSQGQSVVN